MRGFPLVGVLGALCLASLGTAMSAKAEVKPGVSQAETEVCDGQPVLMVVDGQTIDRVRMQEYTRRLLATGLYQALGGYYLNSPRPLETFEGESPANRATLVVRFPCAANARAFWYSRVYQETIKPLRLNPKAGSFNVRIFAEAAPPPFMAGKVADASYTQTFPNGDVAVLPQAERPDPRPKPTPVIRRTLFVVADLDRALALYRDVLGFTVNAPSEVAAGGSEAAIFRLLPGISGRSVTLNAGGEQQDAISLVEWPSHRPLQGAGARASALVVRVPVPLESVLERLADAGATLLPPSMAGPNREQALLDRDGHLIILHDAPL